MLLLLLALALLLLVVPPRFDRVLTFDGGDDSACLASSESNVTACSRTGDASPNEGEGGCGRTEVDFPVGFVVVLAVATVEEGNELRSFGEAVVTGSEA